MLAEVMSGLGSSLLESAMQITAWRVWRLFINHLNATKLFVQGPNSQLLLLASSPKFLTSQFSTPVQFVFQTKLALCL